MIHRFCYWFAMFAFASNILHLLMVPGNEVGCLLWAAFDLFMAWEWDKA
jgi:hypothetical protein